MKCGRPHLVILGAGASVQAFPKGDKNGKILPTMDNIIDVVGLGELKEFFKNDNKNFEAVYSDIYDNPKYKEIVTSVEKKVRDYFSSLELPDHPTLYDHLILSLRKKDLIATFNWDPFLYKAYQRVSRKITINIPRMCFLHGNVGFKINDKTKILINTELEDKDARETPLLLPIKEKNYTDDPCIASHWDNVQKCLKEALIVTIFGYGAPDSDYKAMQLFQSAWGDSWGREYEEVEIIDIKSEDELEKKWNIFIHTHHYRTSKDFYDSLIAKFPRESCEQFLEETRGGVFLDYGNVFPKDLDWDELREYFYKIGGNIY